jgi:hypothetical protein
MADPDPRWPLERVRRWWRDRPWPVGCNFIPSTAVNQLEMWQAGTFDPETLDRELGWAAGLGLNLVRVYLHDLAWDVDPEGLVSRVERFLGIAAGHGIDTLLVLFDDVWFPEPRPGPQPEPHPGRHNSRWVASPGLPVLERYADDPDVRERLEGYVTGVIAALGRDPRVFGWDLYNEPGGHPSPLSDPVGTRCLPLLRDVFRWARAAAPEQPLTSGLWWGIRPVDPAIHEVQLAGSDLVSFHHYGPPDDLVRVIDALRRRSERPLICTEYLARPLHSRFETHLPIFRERDVGAVHWGLVAGRTQTIFPWWSWMKDRPADAVREPSEWFHDVLRADGTPFDEAEARFLRELLVGDVG